MFNPDQNRLAPTLAMIMAASLVGFITGYTVPLISLELAQQQVAPLYVGLLAALVLSKGQSLIRPMIVIVSAVMSAKLLYDSHGAEILQWLGIH